ncbi:MAG: hypothetical protein GY835_14050 [bacterium]|nr:hypothetical protein [bacterium]
MSGRTGILVLILSLALAWCGGTLAQEGPGEAAADSTIVPVPVDSLATGVADSTSTETATDGRETDEGEFEIPLSSSGVHPSFSTASTSQDRFFNRKDMLSLSVAWPNSWIVGASISYDETTPRDYGREMVKSSTSLNTSMKLWGIFPTNLSVGNSYTDMKSTSVTSTKTNYTETSNVNMAIRGAKDLSGWLSVNGSANLGANTKDYNNSDGVTNQNEGGVRNLVGHLNLDLKENLKVVTGYRSDVILGKGELLGVSSDLESRIDSMRLEVNYNLGAKLAVSMSGGQQSQVIETLDFFRNQYGTIEDSTDIAMQEMISDDWGGDVNVTWSPSPKFKITTRGSVKTHRKRVANRDVLSKDTDTYLINVSSDVKPWRNAEVKINYEQTRNLSVDVSADTEKYNRKMNVRGSQKLSDTFSMSFVGTFLLNQDFYANTERNPQDRDKMQTSYAFDVKGRIASWLTATNEIKWNENRDIFILASRSSSNKDKRTLSWRGRLDYNFLEKYLVKQQCIVSVDEDDFIFTEDRNALDREFTLFTESTLPIYKSVKLLFDHEFRLREMGSYKPDTTVVGSPKTFFRSSRKKTEKLTLGVVYSYRSYLMVTCEEEVGREIDYSYIDHTQKSKIFGNLEFEIAFNRSLGSSGSISAKLRQKLRFGKYVPDNQRSLWFPSLNISYTF